LKIILASNNFDNLLNFRYKLIKTLLKKNYQVYLLAPKNRSINKINNINCKYVSINFYSHSKSIVRNIKLIFDYFFIIKKIKPDFFLSFTIKPNIIGSFVSNLLKIKTINTISGLGSSYINNFFLRKLTFLFYKLSLFKSQKIFFHNKYDLSIFLRSNIVKKKQAEIISGSGVNINIRKKKNYNIRKNSFIFIGRLIKDKGINEYINLARYFKFKLKKNFNFYIVGQLDKNNPLSIKPEFLNYLNKTKVIKFLGSVDNISKIIDLASCVVLPSYREGLSRTLLECALYKKFIITTDVPGCKDIIKNNINGLLCKPCNNYSLIKTVEKYVNLPKKKIYKMININYRKVRNEYNEDDVVAKYLNEIKYASI
jgi:glycosyltransferase involved in cell wall biosynthesis